MTVTSREVQELNNRINEANRKKEKRATERAMLVRSLLENVAILVSKGYTVEGYSDDLSQDTLSDDQLDTILGSVKKIKEQVSEEIRKSYELNVQIVEADEAGDYNKVRELLNSASPANTPETSLETSPTVPQPSQETAPKVEPATLQPSQPVTPPAHKPSQDLGQLFSHPFGNSGEISL